MKRIIRLLLVAASAFMVVANLHTSPSALVASSLFLTANIAAFVYNEVKK